MTNREKIITRIVALKDLAIESLKNNDYDNYNYCLGEIQGLRFAAKMLGVNLED